MTMAPTITEPRGCSNSGGLLFEVGVEAEAKVEAKADAEVQRKGERER